jgi:subtilase family serine protease
VVVVVLFLSIALLPPVRAQASLRPSDIRAAYDVDPLIQSGYTGKGVTVAIIGTGIGSTFYSDVKSFSREYGLPDPSISWVAPNGTNGIQLTNLTGPTGEITGDTELVHAMAPDAKILLVFVPHNILDGSPYVIDHNAAGIVTSSFGTSFHDNGDGSAARQAEFYNDEYAKAVSEHITLIAASGDTGSNNSVPCQNQSISCVEHKEAHFWTTYLPDSYLMPTYSPWITIVGGTSLQLDPYREVGWAGSAGGVSNLFPEPTWQVGPGVPQNGRRNIPDIALAACDPPYAFYYNNTQSTFCGASGAAPTFAGIIADIDQAAGTRVGFLNPTLYALGVSDPSVYHEITSGCSLVQVGSSTKTGYCAHPGWNFVSGWGSIDAARLAMHFAPSANITPESPIGEPDVFAPTLVMAAALLVSKNQNPRFSS